MRARHALTSVLIVVWTGHGAGPAWGGTPSGVREGRAGAAADGAAGRPRSGAFFETSSPAVTTPGSRASQRSLHDWQRHRAGSWPRPESYMLLKGGGLLVGEAEGLFLGVEAGGTIDDILDFGISLDYFHRSTAERVTLRDTHLDDLPVEVVTTLHESSAHLVPIGLTLRVLLPLGGDTFLPFIAATASYETLFVDNVGDPASDDPILRLLDDNETFSGFGWQASAGLDLLLSPNLSAYGELGMHQSSPSRQLHDAGLPVDLKVDLDGAFLRGGLRFSL